MEHFDLCKGRKEVYWDKMRKCWDKDTNDIRLVKFLKHVNLLHSKRKFVCLRKLTLLKKKKN